MATENVNEVKDTSTHSPDVAKAFYGDKNEVEKSNEVKAAEADAASSKEVESKDGQAQGDKTPDPKVDEVPKEGEVVKAADENKEGQEKKEGEVAKDGEKKAPEKYDLKIPEGSKLKATAVERIDRIAREQGLTNDEAQQLLVQEHEAVKAYSSELDAEFTRVKQNWKAELEKDPELGGDNLKKNSEIARRGLEANFSKKTIELIDQMEYGNNKEFFRDLVKLGKRLSDDKINPSGGNPPAPRKSSGEVFYGK
jgi:hypothetical protein